MAVGLFAEWKTERYSLFNLITQKFESPSYGTLRGARYYAKNKRLRCYIIFKGKTVSTLGDIVYDACELCKCDCPYYEFGGR